MDAHYPRCKKVKKDISTKLSEEMFIETKVAFRKFLFELFSIVNSVPVRFINLFFLYENSIENHKNFLRSFQLQLRGACDVFDHNSRNATTPARLTH